LPVPVFQLPVALQQHEVAKNPVQVASKWKRAQQQKKHRLKNLPAAVAEADIRVRTHSGKNIDRVSG
jgi:hypothetical protein